MPPQFPPTPADRPGPAAPTPGMELVQPVPYMVATWQVPTGQGNAVIMRIATPLGPLHFILSADEAIQIAAQLRQQGKAAKSGITLPPGVRLGGVNVDLDEEVVLDGHGERITEADAEALAAEIIDATTPPTTPPTE